MVFGMIPKLAYRTCFVVKEPQTDALTVRDNLQSVPIATATVRSAGQVQTAAPLCVVACIGWVLGCSGHCGQFEP